MSTRRGVLRLGLAGMLAGCTGAPEPPVRVFAAASLKEALDAAGAAWSARSDRLVQVSYAASSALARQIEQGAPADLFMSADAAWMDYLAARGLIAAQSRRDVVGNRLVLIAPAGSTVALELAPGPHLRQAIGEGRLAMAAPDVPAGAYARAALQSLGLWRSVEDRVAPAENVRAALTFVARGEAPLGVVYATDARVEPAVRIVAAFPDGSHPPIRYPAALTRTGAGRPAAAEFLQFLSGPQASAIFRGYGFTVLGERP